MAQSTFIQTRVSPELAEKFALACQLDRRTTSDALRHLILAYIASLTPTTDDAAPGGSGVEQASRKTTSTAPAPTPAGHT